MISKKKKKTDLDNMSEWPYNSNCYSMERNVNTCILEPNDEAHEQNPCISGTNGNRGGHN